MTGSAPFRLGINGRFLAAPVTGVQRFAHEVVRRIARDTEVTLFVPRGVGAPADIAATTVVGRMKGHAWEQLELPRIAAAHCDVLLQPANSTSAHLSMPSVLVLHDVLPLTGPGWFAAPYALWQRLLIPRAARTAARIVTVSAWSRRTICDATGAGPGRVLISPQGLAPFDRPADDDAVARVRAHYRLPPRFLLAVGGDPRKNTPFLLTMLDRWQQRFGNAPPLVLVGERQRRVHGTPTARNGAPMAGGAAVHALGRVPDEDLHALYTAADALCFPSVAEGFGRPPLEAIASGTPAVAAPFGPAGETLAGLAAARIVPLTADAWIDAIRELVQLSRAQLETDGTRLRARWTWDAAAATVRDACAAAHRERRPGMATLADRRGAPHTAAAPRIAIVHDWLTGMRGGERVLRELLDMYPTADVLTLVHVPGSVAPEIETRIAATSFVDRLPRAHVAHRFYLPLYPMAVERLDLDGYDVVISSSHCAAKGVRTRAPHLSYCHTPMRYVWDQYDAYFGRGRSAPWVRAAMPPIAAGLRRWDASSAARVDAFVANSAHVRDRISNCYGRSAAIVHPPVDVSRFTPAARREDFCLIVSALVPYKRIDLAVAAFNLLRRPLVVVGDGAERLRLERAAGPSVTFRGRLNDAEVADLMGRCRAFIFPGVEDFGITAVEAQAAGAPVVAFARGGALETVIPPGGASPPTGVFFEDATPESLAAAVRSVDDVAWDVDALRHNAQRFSPDRFRDAFRAELERLIGGATPARTTVAAVTPARGSAAAGAPP